MAGYFFMGLANPSFWDLIRRKPDGRITRNERLFKSVFPLLPANLQSSADPYLTRGSLGAALSREPFLVYGRVVDSIAYTHYYKVQLDRGGSVIPCCMMTQTPLNVWGARQFNTLQPNTGVFVLIPPHIGFGLIVGVMPDWMVSAKDALSDQIVQGSNVGLNSDVVHSFPFSLVDNGGIIDWSAGRPSDMLTAGEWGAVTDTGLMFFLDSFMAAVRVDEETGLMLFYDDSLARLCGHNLQFRAAGYDHDMKDDEEEFDVEEGYNPYLWEARGAFDRPTQIFRSVDPQEFQVDTPWYSSFEPVEDDQQSILRYREFRGYLGQAIKRALFILPSDASGVEQYQNLTKYPGVAEENWDLDGNIATRSAMGWRAVKYPIIPSPKRIRLAEDVTGDTSTNYKANGVYGQGTTPQIASEIPGGDNVLHASAFMDMMAYVFNWKGLHQFFYHELDWYIYDESQSEFSSAVSAGIPTFIILQGDQYLPIPPPVTLTVDDRYGEQDYYPNTSGFILLPDGGVEVFDGYGSEAKMTAGSHWLSAPGDIFLQAGRNIYLLAGHDVVIRANNCIDIAANAGDVRVKADNNVYVMGGNNLCGGVLIESKSPAVAFEVDGANHDEVVGGIVLRAKETAIVLYGQQIDLVLSDDGAGPQTRNIILDGGHHGTIIEHANGIYRHVEESFEDTFPNGVVNEYWQDSALIGTILRVAGDTLIDGCLNVTQDIASIGNTTSHEFDIITPAGVIDITDEQAALIAREAYLVTWRTAAIPDITLIQRTTDVLFLQFFFRTSAQCGITTFVLYESLWQQMARLNGQTMDTWTENPVEAEIAFPGQFDYPPPGREAWLVEDSYFMEDLNLFSYVNNYADDRGSAYEDPSYATPTQIPLDGNYTVIKNP